jgi:hypothetical protein
MVKWTTVKDLLVWTFIIGCAIGLLVIALIDIPMIMDSTKKMVDQWKEKWIPIVEEKTYNGTLGMIAYSYGWWGLGAIDTTTLTFVDGQVFSFPHYLKVDVGQNYTVSYQFLTYKDNRTETKPTSITWKPQP